MADVRKIIALLVVLGFIIFSGCVETSQEEQAIELANSTTEGKVANTLIPLLQKTGDCTSAEYQGVADSVQSVVNDAGIGIELPTGDAESANLVASAQACNLQINREVISVEEGTQYRLNYTANAGGACTHEELAEAAADYRLTIEVDLEAGTAVVSEGVLDADQATRVDGLFPAFGLVGNCVAPVMLATDLFEDIVGGEEAEPEAIASNFDAWWDGSQANPLRFSWDYAEQDTQHYVILDLWNTYNTGPLPPMDSTLRELREWSDRGIPLDEMMGMSHVYPAEDEAGDLYWGGDFEYPNEFKVTAYLIDSEFNLVGQVGYKEFAVDVTDFVTDFVAVWDADDIQKPLKFTWNFNPQPHTHYVALDMWNTGNSSPLGSIEQTVTELRRERERGRSLDEMMGMSHVYPAEDEAGDLYWGGEYTYPDVFRIHVYLLDYDYDLLGEVAYAQITRNGPDETVTSIPIEE